MTVFGNLILIAIDFLQFYFSIFALVLVPIEKIYQAQKTVFHHSSKHLEVCQKYSAMPHIFLTNFLLFGNVVTVFSARYIT